MVLTLQIKSLIDTMLIELLYRIEYNRIEYKLTLIIQWKLNTMNAIYFNLIMINFHIIYTI